MDEDKILEIAVRTGSLLLMSGAETYRVEETIVRICRSYGLSCNAFVLPTGIFVSAEGSNGSMTVVRRISHRTVDLSRISRLNALSRRIQKQKPDYRQVMAELDEISQARGYSNTVISAAYALTAFVYVLFFGGTLVESAAAVTVGTVLGLLRFLFRQGSSFPFIEYSLGGFVSGILGSLFSLIPGVNPYLITIGALTNLVPGVALTNGIRDLLQGDIVSGISRLGEALMTVFAIAAGTGMGIAAWSLTGVI